MAPASPIDLKDHTHFAKNPHDINTSLYRYIIRWLKYTAKVKNQRQLVKKALNRPEEFIPDINTGNGNSQQVTSKFFFEGIYAIMEVKG